MAAAGGGKRRGEGVMAGPKKLVSPPVPAAKCPQCRSDECCECSDGVRRRYAPGLPPRPFPAGYSLGCPMSWHMGWRWHVALALTLAPAGCASRAARSGLSPGSSATTAAPRQTPDRGARTAICTIRELAQVSSPFRNWPGTPYPLPSLPRSRQGIGPARPSLSHRKTTWAAWLPWLR